MGESHSKLNKRVGGIKECLRWNSSYHTQSTRRLKFNCKFTFLHGHYRKLPNLSLSCQQDWQGRYRVSEWNVSLPYLEMPGIELSTFSKQSRCCTTAVSHPFISNSDTGTLKTAFLQVCTNCRVEAQKALVGVKSA